MTDTAQTPTERALRALAAQVLRTAAREWDGSDDPEHDPSDPATAFLYERAAKIEAGEIPWS